MYIQKKNYIYIYRYHGGGFNLSTPYATDPDSNVHKKRADYRDIKYF